ncbi:helix-turn-helix transcriptional regulator [uncultured Vagococcus sp.]|uniref:helix-turn-helix domain-containing protein n=1 Tax=uncultured Vagococcus sp. TaxID=189676 RepID=UPI0028D4209D|nr:helix-turn-helix transcriptional regulator [uncultured Vagococcus sp.]
MTLAKNLKYYREANGLTQDAIAHELRISRQSVSKWENGESYPSIDNLIMLRELFNLSIDELIMGEKFLILPFKVGNNQPVRRQVLKRPVFLSSLLGLFTLLVSGSVFWTVLCFIAVMFILVFFFYTLAIDLIYQQWVLEKHRLLFLPASNTFISNLKRMGRILKKEEQLCLQPLNYQDISTITLIYEKKIRDPYTTNLTNYNLTPLVLLSMRDPFYLLVKTKDGQAIHLDLTMDCYQKRVAYQHLTEICHFFEQKSIPVEDPYDILVAQQAQLNLYAYIYQGTSDLVKK